MNIAKTTAFGCTVFNLNLKSKSMEAAATSKTSAGGITADLSEWTRPQISQFAQSICKLPDKVSETILPNVTGKELCGFGKDQLYEFFAELLPDSKSWLQTVREFEKLIEQSKKQAMASSPSSRQSETDDNEAHLAEPAKLLARHIWKYGLRHLVRKFANRLSKL